MAHPQRGATNNRLARITTRRMIASFCVSMVNDPATPGFRAAFRSHASGGDKILSRPERPPLSGVQVMLIDRGETMTSARSVRAIVFAAAATLAVGVAGTAHAAVTAPLLGHAPAARATVTQVHWEWRHHHRYWVPDRRRYDRR